MWARARVHSVEDMQSLLVAMTLAASVQVPTAATPLGCEFVYLRDSAGYSVCHIPAGYQHRPAGLCTWQGHGDPSTSISEYAVLGPWADWDARSAVSCQKYYYLSAHVETR